MSLTCNVIHCKSIHNNYAFQSSFLIMSHKSKNIQKMTNALQISHLAKIYTYLLCA